MGYMEIRDLYGEPLEVDNGLYFRFAEIGHRGSKSDKSSFLREWRILPCEKAPTLQTRVPFICDRPEEFDAIDETMRACSRLAAFAYGRGNGGQWGKNSLDGLQGLESGRDWTALRIALDGCMWYRYALMLACEYDHYDFLAGHELLAYINEPHGRACEPRVDLKPDKPPTITGAAPYFNGPRELVIWTAETGTQAAAQISETLVLMHTATVRTSFTMESGFSLMAPMGICALWADFAQCFAKRPIRICKYCGLPIVQNEPPRGQPRKYCPGNSCRMRDKRRERKQAEQAQEQPTAPDRALR